MHDDFNPLDESFPWLGLLGCLVLIIVVIGVALGTGTCTSEYPC